MTDRCTSDEASASEEPGTGTGADLVGDVRAALAEHEDFRTVVRLLARPGDTPREVASRMLKRLIRPTPWDILNSPFVVTALAGALLTLISLIWNTVESNSRMAVERQRQQHEIRRQLANDFSNAFYRANSALGTYCASAVRAYRSGNLRRLAQQERDQASLDDARAIAKLDTEVRQLSKSFDIHRQNFDESFRDYTTVAPVASYVLQVRAIFSSSQVDAAVQSLEKVWTAFNAAAESDELQALDDALSAATQRADIVRQADAAERRCLDFHHQAQSKFQTVLETLSADL